MKVLNGNQIRSVTPQGIVYVDEDVEKSIDFAACYENYLKRRLTPEAWERHKELNPSNYWDWDDYVERISKFREVGRLNPLAPPWADGPFVEFHTEPSLRFKFDTDADYISPLEAILEAIHEGGWHTFDLS